MKIISRCIILELLIYIAEAAILFTFVFLIKDIYEITDLLVTGGSNLWTIMKMLFAIIPAILVMTFPMAVLLSCMMVYGRMAQENELTALQAGGYSPLQLILPALVLGILITLLLFWWNHRIAPKGLRTFNMMAADVLRDSATAGIRPGGFNALGDYIFNPSQVNENQMRLLNVFEIRDERIVGVISAPTASVFYDPKTNTLQLRMEDGMVHQMPETDRDVLIHFGQMEFAITLPELLNRVAKITTNTRYLSRNTLENKKNKLLHDYHNSPNKDDPITKWMLEEARDIEVELARRNTLPFAGVLMTVLGALLGMNSSFGKRSACYTVTILMILAYHVLFNLGIAYAEGSSLPAHIGLWLPNAVCLVVIIYFYWRTQRV